MTPPNKKKHLQTLGWREWVALPELGINRVKAKIDTGARTSALHAFSVEPFRSRGKEKIRFAIHPFQRNDSYIVQCVANISDYRTVTDSGGHREGRYVIRTLLAVADNEWPVEITLTNRDIMAFRMLIGRTAIRGKYLVNPQRSFLVTHAGSVLV